MCGKIGFPGLCVGKVHGVGVAVGILIAQSAEGVAELVYHNGFEMFAACIAEVVAVTVDDKYMDENKKFDFTKSDPLAYSHGEYFTLGDNLGKFGFSVRKNK